MPYKIEKRGSKWAVVNKETGKVKGTHDSQMKARSQMRLLYAIERDRGFKPRKKK